MLIEASLVRDDAAATGECAVHANRSYPCNDTCIRQQFECGSGERSARRSYIMSALGDESTRNQDDVVH